MFGTHFAIANEFYRISKDEACRSCPRAASRAKGVLWKRRRAGAAKSAALGQGATHLHSTYTGSNLCNERSEGGLSIK